MNFEWAPVNVNLPRDLNLSKSQISVIKKELEQDDFTLFSRPRIMGSYTLQGDGQRTTARTPLYKLKYLRPLHFYDGVKLDLKIKRHLPPYLRARKPTLESLLNWIVENQMITNQFSKNQITYVCLRDALAKIMRTPYNEFFSWCLCAYRRNNVIYLDEINAKRRSDNDIRYSFLRPKFRRYNFKRFVLSDKANDLTPYKEGELDLDNCCLVYYSRLNNKMILYASEVNGIDENVPLSSFDLTELRKANFAAIKIVPAVMSTRLAVIYDEFKLRSYKREKWWCQNFLAGIDKVVCGYEGKHGIISEIRELNNDDLLNMGNQNFQPIGCVNFLDKFLDFVTREICSKPDCTLLRFEWAPRKPVTCLPGDDYDFMPDWYLNDLENQQNIIDR